MIQLAPTEKCTGCMACLDGCPRSAIELREDALGNVYPQILEENCVKCGKCQKICPEINHLAAKEPGRAYAVWSLNPENRKTSTSGAAAAEFYAKALEEGYWICGAEYAEDGTVVHTLGNTPDAILRYKQSKYVCSDMQGVFGAVKDRLDQGEKVLVISLPCKIAGLLGFLGRKYENLLTVDIVCHGTPSMRQLKEHIQYVAPGLENYRLQFRQDNEYLFSLTKNGKKVYQKPGKTDTYLAAFLDGLNYRESCYHCSYAKQQRISDLTICDFWGLGAEIPFEHPYSGAISAVLVHTSQGQAFFDSCRDSLFVEERPVSEAVRGNAQLNVPAPVHPERKAFENLYQEQGFEHAVSGVLRQEMAAARKEISRRRLRMKARKLAGIFLKRYRG